MASAAWEAVVFDFDYTLVDASAGILPALALALEDIRHPVPDDAALRATIGLSLPQTLQALTGVTDSEVAARFEERFLYHAEVVEREADVVESIVPLPGVALSLAALRAAGFRTAIASTKFALRIAQILEGLGLNGLFDAVVGAEDIEQGRTKPHPDVLLAATERLGVQPTDALYVGDHRVDVEAAARAGMGGFVGVLSGAHGADDLGRPDEPARCVLSLPSSSLPLHCHAFPASRAATFEGGGVRAQLAAVAADHDRGRPPAAAAPRALPNRRRQRCIWGRSGGAAAAGGAAASGACCAGGLPQHGGSCGHHRHARAGRGWGWEGGAAR